jgi:hypothetical protein
MELKFFGGLSVEETAEVLKMSRHTVMQDWKGLEDGPSLVDDRTKPLTKLLTALAIYLLNHNPLIDRD